MAFLALCSHTKTCNQQQVEAEVKGVVEGSLSGNDGWSSCYCASKVHALSFSSQRLRLGVWWKHGLFGTLLL